MKEKTGPEKPGRPERPYGLRIRNVRAGRWEMSPKLEQLERPEEQERQVGRAGRKRRGRQERVNKSGRWESLGRVGEGGEWKAGQAGKTEGLKTLKSRKTRSEKSEKQKRLGRSGRPEVGKAGKSGKAKRVCLCFALSACVRSCLFVLFCFCNGSPQFQSYPDTPHSAACTLDCASNNISLERQYSAHNEQQFPMW